MRRPDLHAWCDYCWRASHGCRLPRRSLGLGVDACCLCLKLTDSGIFTRDDPDALPCRGNHDWYVPTLEAGGRHG